MTRDQTPQEQLEERRERMKRKAEEDLQNSRGRAVSECITASSSIGSTNTKSASCSSIPAGPPASNADAVDNRKQQTELDLDMLLDGLGMDESLKALAREDPVFRDDLIRQLMTVPVPENWNAGGSESFDLDDDDDEYELGDYPLGAATSYGPPRPPLPFTFKDGALRMTRTPGRAESNTPNCISMEELIDKDSLISCCVFAFFIGQSEFYRFPPMQPQAKIPMYVGRDINLDPYAPQVMKALNEKRGTNSKSKISSKQLDKLRAPMNDVYRQIYGENFHPFFPRCQGCAHSKILLLIYPTYLRLVITSCNLMNIDLCEGDNHWYIHDVPRYASNKALAPNTAFEKLLTVHLRDLSVPSSFFDFHFSGRFDFSSVKVHLVTSRPGISSGLLAESNGLLRLRKIVSELEERSEMIKNGVSLEYCSGSIGHLSDKWLKEFYDCAIGRKLVSLAKLDCDIPPIEVVFPTYTDVEECDDLARTVASKNIGCHMNWGNAREEIQRIFRHYKSKDPGKLFHMKFLMALNAKDRDAVPYYVYVGSANFSTGAWGKLNKAPKADKEAPMGSLRVESCANYECGVVIPRSILMKLLEPGSNWQDIVPYERPAKPYDLETSDGSNRPFLKNPNEGPAE
ncbi:phospholipase D/nuclease [Cystobasidium minutum MCA 4210]|uniref:phospholipase D/nuclease n=1 Tax=Cystobasidium minutum MCA 4210 TaxID=1397322 RepID=UPI0034CD31C1|eukprot:jgi/Rhomi1/57771/CE57770_565